MNLRPRYENTDINQLYLDWSGLPDTSTHAGRKSIKLDNVRFIGKLNYVDYNPGDSTTGKVDTRKLWLTLVYNY